MAGEESACTSCQVSVLSTGRRPDSDRLSSTSYCKSLPMSRPPTAYICLACAAEASQHTARRLHGRAGPLRSRRAHVSPSSLQCRDSREQHTGSPLNSRDRQSSLHHSMSGTGWLYRGAKIWRDAAAASAPPADAHPPSDCASSTDAFRNTILSRYANLEPCRPVSWRRWWKREWRGDFISQHGRDSRPATSSNAAPTRRISYLARLAEKSER